jgi:hypothetical protein
MKGTQWRFIIALIALGLGYYFFIYQKDQTPEPPVDETKAWPSKVEALAQMKTNLSAIVDAERNAKLLSGSYIPCDPNPAEIPERERRWSASDAAGWKELEIMMPSHTWFQYEVVITDPESFIVYARTRAEGGIVVYTMDQDYSFRSQ